MGAAKKLKYQGPKFKAITSEDKRSKDMHVNSHHLKIDPLVLVTWALVIAITVAFWMLIVKLF